MVAADITDSIELMFETGWTDGLPVQTIYSMRVKFAFNATLLCGQFAYGFNGCKHFYTSFHKNLDFIGRECLIE